MRPNPMSIAWFTIALLTVRSASGQAVVVTASLETNRVAVGGVTTLHVYARIAPAVRDASAGIFSWHVDLLAGANAVARLDFNNLKRPLSDNEVQTSSGGFDDGVNRRGIRDTFLNLTGAGQDGEVELFSVPVHAEAPGSLSFAVQAGTGIDGLESDFVVLPNPAGPLLLGGDYSLAQVQLEVMPVAGAVKAGITHTPLPGGRGELITVRFQIAARIDYVVERSAALEDPGGWKPLPGAPHNLGFADDTNNVPQRFYRIRADVISPP